MPAAIKIDYHDGYAIIGMPETYTMHILAIEFTKLTHSWRILSIPCIKRDYRGWAVHEMLVSWTLDDDFTDHDDIRILPVRIQEGATRGTEIRPSSDHLQILDHWAQASQTAQVGISIAEGQQQIEYWLSVKLDQIADDPLQTYLTAHIAKRHEALVGLAPLIAHYLVGQEIEYVFKMRYLANTLRVWLTPLAYGNAGYRWRKRWQRRTDRYVRKE
jgi:hypothetical protein